MMPPSIHRQTGLLNAAIVTLIGLCLIWALASQSHSAAAGRTFDSPLRPTHTPKPTRTPKAGGSPTPTLGAFVSPLSTPTPSGNLRPGDFSTQRTYLPLVAKNPTPFPTPGPYGWKGIDDTWEADAIGLDAAPANQFWGLAPSWWYDWGYRVRDVAAQSASSPTSALAILEAGLTDIGYVPMIYCPSDVSSSNLSPQDAASLARKYPGRVWLLFNEPDILGQCGGAIRIKYPGYVPLSPAYASPEQWADLGKYLGQQYILYYDAIKAVDPGAKLFSFGAAQMPLPTLSGVWWPGGVSLWNAFLGELVRQDRSLDGIALHVYPGSDGVFHTGCVGEVLDYQCVQEALVSAHRYFQGTDTVPSQNPYVTLTNGKPIWITEIGALKPLNYPVQGQPLTWARVREGFETPMLTWFSQNTVPGGSCASINGVSWFSTHSKDPYGSPPGWDYTASNLLDHLSFPTQRRLTEIGAAWRDAVCVTCQCPGPGCP